ncbi:MAG TPA: AAA family ATPase, partial [Candidatus Bathyarchaeia archaeon]|nr:AAA family ATPase [Candidatus Bathyarchaeia archaeon]
MASRAGRTFRVFVSSTFADLKAERDALQRFVFPRLRDLCLRHGCRFQAIDLRWGVRDEAALDQKTMRICLDEIARCQKTSPRPNFIILLGDRYGWRPLPWQIPAAEMQALRPHFSGDGDAALVEDWYRRDDNAVPPVYVLRPRVLSDAARRGETPEAQAERAAEAAAWSATERRLQAILRPALDRVPLTAEAREKYLASATEQEITRGAMAAAEAEAHFFAFVRILPELTGGAEPPATAVDFVDTIESGGARRADDEAHRLLADLRDVRLPARLPGHIHRYEARLRPAGGPGGPITTDHVGGLPDDLDACLALGRDDGKWPGLCRDVWTGLSSVILAEIAALEAVEPLSQEIRAHRDFGADRRRFFVGREAPLASVAAYLASDARTPFAVLGPSGSGKSAFLAMAAERARPFFAAGFVMERYIGATPDSTNGRALLERLCAELARIAAEPGPPEGADFRDLTKALAGLLEAAGRKGRLLVVVDALDQLSDAENARELLWLPETLPPNVKVIVSALPGDSAEALTRKLPEAARLTLEPMSASEGGALLDAWLADEGRTLTPAQKSLVLDRFAGEGRPLYLKLACDYARRWPSFAAPASLVLSPGIPGLLGDLFDRLASDANHGPTLVSRGLGYLAAAKNGLSEDELLDVLSRDETVYADFIARAHHEP